MCVVLAQVKQARKVLDPSDTVEKDRLDNLIFTCESAANLQMHRLRNFTKVTLQEIRADLKNVTESGHVLPDQHLLVITARMGSDMLCSDAGDAAVALENWVACVDLTPSEGMWSHENRGLDPSSPSPPAPKTARRDIS